MTSLKVIKVLVYGNTDAGKAAFIDAVKDIIVLDSSSIKQRKNNALKKFDYGSIFIDETVTVQLFSQSGLMPSLEGNLELPVVALLIVNPSKTDNYANQLAETKRIIESIEQSDIVFLIGFNKRKSVQSYTIAELREMLELPDSIPMLECDPVSDPASARRVLIELFKLLPEDELVKAAIQKLGE